MQMPNDNYREVSRKRIIELIEEFCGTEADRKQQAFADMCGISKYSVSQYVNGTNAPGNITAAKIGKKCRVDPLWVMGFDVPKRKKFTATFSLSDLNSAIDKSLGVEETKQQSYYYDEETAKVAQAIFDDSALHALFDAAQNSRSEDLQMAADLLKRLKGTNPDG